MQSTELKQPTSAPAGSERQAPAFQPPKKKKKWPKRLVILAVVVLAVFLGLRLLTGGSPTALAGAYLSDTALVQDMTVAISGTGTVQPIDSYKVTALVKGEILSSPFEEGQTVQKDDVLFVLDAGDVESSLKQGQTGVEQAQLGVESAQLSYDSLLRTQRDNAKDRQVKANATGVVNKVYVDPGDNVAAGTPIADILDRDNMKLTVPFHAADAAGFYVGQPALVSVDGTSETLSGVISELSATNSVGPGGTLVRNVTIVVTNPGALSPASTGTASVGPAFSAASASFAYNASKQLVAKYTGELERLDIKEGDRVTDGQVVGEFKEQNFQDQLDAAVINLKNAQLTLKNAQNNLEKLQDSLENYTITAPISGTIIEKNYKAGDNVDPSTAAASGAPAFMAVIYDMTTLTFDLSINELDIGKIRVGQEVEVSADALDGKTFTGRVDKVNINGTTVNGKTTYPVTVKLEGSGEELLAQGLYPGMNISARVIVEQAGSVLCVPVEYVVRGNKVLVAGEGALDENGNVTDKSKIEERQVTLGRSSEEYIEILDGLEEGETVLLENRASSVMAMMMGG